MARGTPCILLAKRNVTLLRGRRDGLEVDFFRVATSPKPLTSWKLGLPSGQASIAARSRWRIRRHDPVARGPGAIARAARERRIALRALSGDGEELERLAQTEGLRFERAPSREPATRSRTPRPSDDVPLSDSARSLVADFAGARSDIARAGGAARPACGASKLEPESARTPHELRLVETPPTTLYHTVTLRGGQALHHVGNIVVVGDVNPGAELIATGDILVFGRLAGIAHAGAQGDENARIYALDLAATQLRIATFIAADDGVKRRGAPAPEVAVVRDARIVIFLDRSRARVAERMSARRIVITSGKGGVGKTTTTANLGATLAKRGKRVILIDADIGLRNLDLVLGLEKRIVFDLVEVAEGRCQLRQALIKDKRFESLAILPAAQTREKDAISPTSSFRQSSSSPPKQATTC